MLISLTGCHQEELQLLEHSSYFSDYKITDGKVHIICYLTVANNSNQDCCFELSAVSNKDVEIGLLKDVCLKGLSEDLQEDKFYIPQKSTLSFYVTFVGDYAGNDQKCDRNLPEISIVRLT